MGISYLDSEEEPLVVGDDYDVERTITNIPVGDQLAMGKLTIKASEFDADGDAVLVKEITTSASAGQGQITDPGDSTGEGEALFQLTAEDTAALDPYFEYVYDIQFTTANGKKLTRERGQVVPRGQTTEA